VFNLLISRRRFISRASVLTGGVVVAGSGAWSFAQSESRQASRLSVKPGPVSTPAEPGLHPLKLRAGRDALFYIPESARQFKKVPLLISLHGATRNSDRAIELFRKPANELGFAVLAPASEDRTWDAIGGSFGPDIAFINQSLAKALSMVAVEPARIAMAGFSDGASYSLSVGLANGDLFCAVFGFSPGFIIPGEFRGHPPVFISHGTADQILPIESCSRRIVPALKHSGYDVTYREFDGPHTLPPDIGMDAMRWFLSRQL
jgi:phospholipase/carboxylesterase